jgi:hypothetical protein
MVPTRSGAVLTWHAGIGEKTGQLTDADDGEPRRMVISSDFCTVYEPPGKKADGLVNLYCSAHIRRYFVWAGDANPAQLTYWTQAWLDRIRDLCRAHNELTAVWQEAVAPAPQQKAAAAAWLQQAGRAWDGALAVIGQIRKKKEAQAPGLTELAKKTLVTSDRERDGLAAHRGYPRVSLDNTVAIERSAAGRDSGTTPVALIAGTPRNAAVIWTAPARMADLSELTYLTACLHECDRNGGKPLCWPTLERFLPWNAIPEDLRTWAQPRPTG